MDVDVDSSPNIVGLDEPAAADRSLTGAKAANLAAARLAGLPALPGFVLTTAWDPTASRQRAAAVEAWRQLSGDGTDTVVVRSSSTGEDGGSSSMAGVFDSVLDVADETGFLEAVDTVHRSAAGGRAAGVVDAEMAVLVQPMLDARWGGVLFGADPVTGRRDRLVVAAVAGGPAALVSGEVDGWTAALGRSGRVREVRSTPGATDATRPPADVLRGLARLAAAVTRTYGGPQDMEWAVDGAGTLHLLQARPITTLAPRSGAVLGPGPVAESFPEALGPLEQDLWLEPLREGLREALLLAGTSTPAALGRSPIVVAVDGMAAADLGVLGVDAPAGGFLRRLDPRPPARRLRAAWRVGRLRSALPDIATDVVRRVDADLLALPTLDDLANHELVAVVRNSRRTLTALHGHEALAGLLIPEASTATVTGASLALSAVAQARAEGVSLCDLVEHDPVVLALVPPRVGEAPRFDVLAGIDGPIAHPADAGDPDPAAIAREALRLRVRWVQELMARASWELGRRLVDVGVLPSQEAVRLLALDELATAVQRRSVPADLAARAEPTGRPLPARFRLAEDGRAVATPAPVRRRRRGGAGEPAAVGAGGGIAVGPVHHHDPTGDPAAIPAGSVLVVPHLDPRLATVVGRLAGLVAETGSPLSHLAILAREHGVATVVGYAGAATRLPAGSLATVDGQAGTVRVEPAPEPEPVRSGAEHRVLEPATPAAHPAHPAPMPIARLAPIGAQP